MNELFKFIFEGESLDWEDKIYIWIIGYIFLCVIIYSCLYPEEDKRMSRAAAKILRRQKMHKRPLLYVVSVVTEEPENEPENARQDFIPTEFLHRQVVETKGIISTESNDGITSILAVTNDLHEIVQIRS